MKQTKTSTYTLQDFFKDSEINVTFNSKLKKEDFNSFNKFLKVFRLRTNANQNLILSALVEKSLESKQKDSVFLFCKKYEAVNLGLSRSTLERFFGQLVDLEIIVKVASKELETEKKTINAYAFNVEKLNEFLEAELRFNQYYKAVFGDEKDFKKKPSQDAILSEISIRDEKIAELEKLVSELRKNAIPNLKEGEAIYNIAEVERLQSEFADMQKTLSALVQAHENLSDKYQDLQNANDKATLVLEAKNRELEQKLQNSKSIQNVKDSQDYKDLCESNKLLESTAQRLTSENEALKRELESLKSNSNNSDKVAELENRLQKANETFKAQKAQIETLQNSGGDIEVIRKQIEAEVKEKANNALSEKWTQLATQKDLELETKIKELTHIQEVERDKLRARIDELERSATLSQGVNESQITLKSFVEKAIPIIQEDLNPTQRVIIKNKLKSLAQDLMQGLQDEPTQIEAESEAQAISGLRQDDLPF